MRHDLLQLAAQLARRGEPFVLATVVNRAPPISTQVGDAAIVTADGGFHGWVGGSCTRPTVIAEAAKALADGRPRFIALDPEPEARGRPGVSTFPMTCHSGGTVEIYLEPVLPAPRLLVFGASPIARALARLGKAMGYFVAAVDAHADAAAFPDADGVFTDPADPGLAAVKPGATFAVVATQGQWDEDAVVAAAGHAPRYLAVVASPRRFGEMRALLAGRLAPPVLRAIRNPAGLDIGARGPEEVAISILAEIVKERHAAPRGLPVATATAAAATERDPICGMTVAVEGARHRAEYEGRQYYFCCAGCREKFLAAPGQYAATPASGR